MPASDPEPVSVERREGCQCGGRAFPHRHRPSDPEPVSVRTEAERQMLTDPMYRFAIGHVTAIEDEAAASALAGVREAVERHVPFVSILERVDCTCGEWNNTETFAAHVLRLLPPAGEERVRTIGEIGVEIASGVRVRRLLPPSETPPTKCRHGYSWAINCPECWEPAAIPPSETPPEAPE